VDSKKLEELVTASYGLISAVEALIWANESPDNFYSTWPSHQEFVEHLGNLAGCYRMDIGRLYNSVDEWQDI
jgi:hypothetical protein